MLVTASKPDTAAPIDVQGELILNGPSDRAVMLTATGSQLVLDSPAWTNLQGLGPHSLAAQRCALVNVTSTLRTLSLTLQLRIDGRRTFGIGSGIKTTLFARLLGLPSTDIRLSHVVNWLRSRAAPRHAVPR